MNECHYERPGTAKNSAARKLETHCIVFSEPLCMWRLHYSKDACVCAVQFCQHGAEPVQEELGTESGVTSWLLPAGIP